MIVATLAARWLLAVVLVVAAVGKLGRSDAFAEAISRYGLLPDSVVPPTARGLPILELLLGALLAAGVFVAPVAIACAGLFGVFAAAVTNSLARGQSFDCGCGLGTETWISWWHVVRGALFVGLSMLVANEPAVLAINASHVRGAPTTNQLVAVPLGVVLICATGRLGRTLRETLSTVTGLRRSRRASPLRAEA